MREKDSVAVYFVQVMVHALREEPERLAAVLAEAGIDPALLGQPEARVPASAFAALWLIQIRELRDEFFQLDSHGLPPGAFALICRGLIQEPTLEKPCANAWPTSACSCATFAAASVCVASARC